MYQHANLAQAYQTPQSAEGHTGKCSTSGELLSTVVPIFNLPVNSYFYQFSSQLQDSEQYLTQYLEGLETDINLSSSVNILEAEKMIEVQLEIQKMEEAMRR